MYSSYKFKNNLTSGAVYFCEGIKLLWRPELRLYIIVPLLVNCILFVALTSVFLHYYGNFIDFAMDKVPSWLAPLAWIAWILLGILLLIVYGYSFNMITNLIAAPFYGMLAARAEALVTGIEPPHEPIGKMVPRTLFREVTKLFYFLSRGIVIVLVMILVSTLPLINVLAPFIGIAWSAWSMSIQYSDFSADNNQLSFKPLRICLWKKKFSSLGFGGIVMLCSITPIINIFVMPVAVIGGTLFWLHELKACHAARVNV